MRLWSISPQYLDTKGLLAVWREGLLALKVLRGETKGYKNHPQLSRFKQSLNPLHYISSYLYCIYQEATKRNYKFNITKAEKYIKNCPILLTVTSGQLEFEFEHLQNKLRKRNRAKYLTNLETFEIEPHSLFHVVEGGIEPFERIAR